MVVRIARRQETKGTEQGYYWPKYLVTGYSDGQLWRERILLLRLNLQGTLEENKVIELKVQLGMESALGVTPLRMKEIDVTKVTQIDDFSTVMPLWGFLVFLPWTLWFLLVLLFLFFFPVLAL